MNKYYQCFFLQLESLSSPVRPGPSHEARCSLPMGGFPSTPKVLSAVGEVMLPFST